MPDIYQGVCSHCDHKSAILTYGYHAVLVDQPVTDEQTDVPGAVLFNGNSGECAVTHDPRFVILAHPIEDLILARTGYSWSGLFWKGRYVAVKNVVCRHCGTVFQRRKLAPPGWFDIVIWLLMALPIGIVVSIWKRHPSGGYLQGLAAAIIVAGAYEALSRGYIYLRFRERARSIAAEVSCPACQAIDSVSIARAKNICCASCGEKSVTFGVVGMS